MTDVCCIPLQHAFTCMLHHPLRTGCNNGFAADVCHVLVATLPPARHPPSVLAADQVRHILVPGLFRVPWLITARFTVSRVHGSPCCCALQARWQLSLAHIHASPVNPATGATRGCIIALPALRAMHARMVSRSSEDGGARVQQLQTMQMNAMFAANKLVLAAVHETARS